jgi:hypothetical protein
VVRRKIPVVIIIAITSAFLAGGIASARAVADTTVTIKVEGSDYFGFVKSDRPLRCAEGRKVVVYKQKGDAQSPRTDKRVGMDTASLNGDRYMWSTGNSGVYGKIYARAGRTEFCKADSSPTIRVPRPA